jgi:hypothetical protein
MWSLQRSPAFALMALAVLAFVLPSMAQERDPTRPPAGAFTQAPPPGEAAKPALPEVDSAAVVVREGKPYLVSGTRLFAVGQSIGPYKIERIGETEVWLRNGKELRKIQRFSGIERHTATERPTP